MKNKSTEAANKQTLGIGTGLKQGSVRLVKYKPEWNDIFQSEADRIRACVGDITQQIEHVGSTSVPGLIAKPIIDIAIAVESRKDMFLVVERLLNAGYIDGGDQDGDGGYLVERDSSPGVRILYIHIVEKTDVQWRNYITFRDCLRSDKDIRNKYAHLKKILAKRFPQDRKSYTGGKAEFIKSILSKITA
jgi:GrpB-like predicted nucleotidyltransferase (UPF0157 family)